MLRRDIDNDAILACFWELENRGGEQPIAQYIGQFQGGDVVTTHFGNFIELGDWQEPSDTHFAGIISADSPGIDIVSIELDSSGIAPTGTLTSPPFRGEIKDLPVEVLLDLSNRNGIRRRGKRSGETPG